MPHSPALETAEPSKCPLQYQSETQLCLPRLQSTLFPQNYISLHSGSIINPLPTSIVRKCVRESLFVSFSCASFSCLPPLPVSTLVATLLTRPSLKSPRSRSRSASGCRRLSLLSPCKSALKTQCSPHYRRLALPCNSPQAEKPQDNCGSQCKAVLQASGQRY